MPNYILKRDIKINKHYYYLEDETGKIVYEAKMLKFSLLFASPFEFTNHLTNKTEEHKIGKTITTTSGSNVVTSFLSKRSYYKYDDQKIWDYLHDKGIRINSKISNERVGMVYEVTLEGKPLATIATASLGGNSLSTFSLQYNVTCEEKDLDLVFLIVFSIVRTEQTFYN